MKRNDYLPPPGNTQGIKSEAIARPGKKGKWKWELIDHTAKQEAKRERFFKAMKKADKEGETSFDY